MHFPSQKSVFTADSGKDTKQMLFTIKKIIEHKKDLILSKEFKGNNLINNYSDSENNNHKANESKMNDKISSAGNFIRKINKKSIWTLEEDNKLRELIGLYGKKSWKEISNNFTNKSRRQCFLRWRKHLSKNFNNLNSNNDKTFTDYRIKSNKSINNLNYLKKQNSENPTNKTWSQNEDEVIIRWVNIMGNKNWTKCSKLLIDKTPKDCKSRWFTKLAFEDRNLNSCNSSADYWSQKDEILLLLFIRKFGTCWSKLAKFFENKSGNQIKNKFYCLARLAFKNTNIANTDNKQSNSSKNIYYVSTTTNNNGFYSKAVIDNKDEFVEESFNCIKEKAEKIIGYLVNSNDEFVYDQNLKLFREAKKSYTDKLKAVYSCNDNVSNCISYLDSKENCSEIFNKKISEVTLNKKLEIIQHDEKAHQIKQLKLCSCCLEKLKTLIKRKIILKMQNSNFKAENLKNFHMQNAFVEVKTNNDSNYKSNAFNLSFNANLDKSKLINKLPQLFELINSIKDKIIV